MTDEFFVNKSGKIGDWTYKSHINSFEVRQKEDDLQPRNDDNQQEIYYDARETQEPQNMSTKQIETYGNKSENEMF